MKFRNQGSNKREAKGMLSKIVKKDPRTQLHQTESKVRGLWETYPHKYEIERAPGTFKHIKGKVTPLGDRKLSKLKKKNMQENY